uniref:Uncharacterized protein n=1 Tax=Arundo donax TaxID=35708 RepID=A0A0A8YWN1_ARUDO
MFISFVRWSPGSMLSGVFQWHQLLRLGTTDDVAHEGSSSLGFSYW